MYVSFFKMLKTANIYGTTFEDATNFLKNFQLIKIKIEDVKQYLAVTVTPTPSEIKVQNLYNQRCQTFIPDDYNTRNDREKIKILYSLSENTNSWYFCSCITDALAMDFNTISNWFKDTQYYVSRQRDSSLNAIEFVHEMNARVTILKEIHELMFLINSNSFAEINPRSTGLTPAVQTEIRSRYKIQLFPRWNRNMRRRYT